MSTIIKFELKELRKLANDKDSCVLEKTVTQNLALQPWCLGNLKDSIKSLLDYKIGKVDKEFNGILLSYKNLRILQNVGTIRNDDADVHFQVQADYFIFQPRVGATLRGIVNKKSVTHLGVLVHRVFNVVIPRPTEEPGNKWLGSTILEGQEVVFRIVVLDLVGALPYIRGELDEKCLQYAGDMEDDVLKHRYIDPLNVSYVNFDKTKPNLQKYTIGDSQHQRPPRISTQSPTKCTVQINHQKNKIEPNKVTKVKNSNSLQASASNMDACAENNVIEKQLKIKRQSTSKVDACAENKITEKSVKINRPSTSKVDAYAEKNITEKPVKTKRQSASNVDTCAENNIIEKSVKIKRQSTSKVDAWAENNITEKPVKIKKLSKALDETMTPKNIKKNRKDPL